MSTKNVAAVAGQSDDSDVVAGLSFKQRERRFVNVLIRGTQKPWLLDCGSDISVVDKKVAKELQIPYKPVQGSQVRSVSNNGLAIIGRAKVRTNVEETTFSEVVFVAEQLCDSVILGSSALAKFQSLTINCGGLAPPLIVTSQCSDSFSGETAGFVKTDPFPIFTLTEDAVPVRCPSRFRTESDKQFIADEISKLLKAGIIEESQSPWRSHVVISTNANHKKRLSIDYASTINRFTIPDGYPIAVIEELPSRVSNCKWYSNIDLISDRLPPVAFAEGGAAINGIRS